MQMELFDKQDLFNALSTNKDRVSLKIFENVNVKNQKLTEPFFANCIFNNCSFFNYGLIGADLQGTEFKLCVFDNVDFGDASISSCNFINCRFINCNFVGSDILDCQFEKCEICSIKFNDASMNNSIFKNCTLIKFIPNNISAFSNDFVQCKFIECKLTSSIFYSIFIKCKFEETIIDAKIIGTQFGLDKSNLQKCAFIYNKETIHSTNKVLKLLNETYSSNSMFFEEYILNFVNTANIDVTLENLIVQTLKMLDYGYIMQAEQIRFARRIVENLYATGRILPYRILIISNEINKLSAYKLKKKLQDAIFNEVLILSNTIFIMKNEILNNYGVLTELVKSNFELFHDTIFEITYKHCPQKRLYEMLNNKDSVKDTLIPLYEKKGSFIEGYSFENIIQVCVAVITLLDYGFKGLKALIAYIKKKLNEKKARTEQNECAMTEYNKQIIKKISYEEINLSEHEISVINSTVQIFIEEKTIINKYYSSNNFKHFKFK